MKEKLVRIGKICLILLIVVLLICLGIKRVTDINVDSIESVTIKYVPNYNVYTEHFLGGYETAVTSHKAATIKEFIDYMEKMDERQLREDMVLDPPGFPCYIIQFKNGRKVEAHVTVSINRAVVDNLPFGARSMFFPEGNPYYEMIEKRMDELVANAK